MGRKLIYRSKEEKLAHRMEQYWANAEEERKKALERYYRRKKITNSPSKAKDKPVAPIHSKVTAPKIINPVVEEVIEEEEDEEYTVEPIDGSDDVW
jgi:hypothetical protein